MFCIYVCYYTGVAEVHTFLDWGVRCAWLTKLFTEKRQEVLSWTTWWQPATAPMFDLYADKTRIDHR